MSGAVNEPTPSGLASPKAERRFVQRTEALGGRMNVSSVANVLETLEGSDHR